MTDSYIQQGTPVVRTVGRGDPSVVRVAQGHVLFPAELEQDAADAVAMRIWVDHELRGTTIPDDSVTWDDIRQTAEQFNDGSTNFDWNEIDAKLREFESSIAERAADVFDARAQVAASLSADTSPDIVGLTTVSAEGFLSLLESTLTRTDDEIQRRRNTIEHNLSISRRHSAELQALQALSAVSSREDGIDDISKVVVTVPGHGTIDAMKLIESAGLQEILQLDEVAAGTSLDTDVIQRAIDTVRERQSQSTSDNEIQMIALRQSMQDRGRQIQLVSGLLNMFHEAQSAVVQNFR